MTMMSASSSAPDSSSSPFSVNVSIRSVTTDADPSLIALKRSPSGTRHIRWSHGLYGRREVGVDVVPVGKLLLEALAEELLHQLGPPLAELVEGLGGEGVDHRTTSPDQRSGMELCMTLTAGFRAGIDRM